MGLILQVLGVFFVSALLGALIGWGIVSLVMSYFNVGGIFDEE
jgi:hypothetical protein